MQPATLAWQRRASCLGKGGGSATSSEVPQRVPGRPRGEPSDPVPRRRPWEALCLTARSPASRVCEGGGGGAGRSQPQRSCAAEHMHGSCPPSRLGGQQDSPPSSSCRHSHGMQLPEEYCFHLTSTSPKGLPGQRWASRRGTLPSDVGTSPARTWGAGGCGLTPATSGWAHTPGERWPRNQQQPNGGSLPSTGVGGGEGAWSGVRHSPQA